MVAETPHKSLLSKHLERHMFNFPFTTNFWFFGSHIAHRYSFILFRQLSLVGSINCNTPLTTASLSSVQHEVEAAPEQTEQLVQGVGLRKVPTLHVCAFTLSLLINKTKRRRIPNMIKVLDDLHVDENILFVIEILSVRAIWWILSVLIFCWSM